MCHDRDVDAFIWWEWERIVLVVIDLPAAEKTEKRDCVSTVPYAQLGLLLFAIAMLVLWGDR
jgi:hypothetical protein